MRRRTTVLVSLLLVVVTGTALAVGLTGSQTALNGCDPGKKYPAHVVTIRNGKASEVQTAGKLCETFTVTNWDNTPREIAFGVHDHHMAYDGVEEKLLGKGKSLTVTLDKTGVYHWHDHLHDEVEGYLTVTK